ECGAFNHSYIVAKRVIWCGCLRASPCAFHKRWDDRWSLSPKRESHNHINGVGRTLPPPDMIEIIKFFVNCRTTPNSIHAAFGPLEALPADQRSLACLPC